MKIKLALLATSFIFTPCAAHAVVIYNFVVAPILDSSGSPLSTVDRRTFTFQIGDEAPTTGLSLTYPNYRVHTYSYTEFGSNTPVIVPATSGKNIVFFDAVNQGGLSLTNSGVRNFFVYNTVLYDDVAYKAALLTNAAAMPVFNLGTIAVSTTPRNNGPRPQDNYTVTISTLAAVPEPASWAMMLAGFGIVGGAMRYRRRNTTISFG